MKIRYRLLASLVFISGLAAAGRAQTYVGNLNGTSVQSTFTTSTDGFNAIGGFGWSLPSGATIGAQIFGQSGGTNNDVLVAQSGTPGGPFPFNNYQVEFNTSATLLPNSTYTLSISMGFVSAGSAGTASYLFSLGTLNGTTFTVLQSASGTINRASGPTFAATIGGNVANAQTVSFNVTTGASGLPTDPIYVRWEQTASSNTGGADYFGIDNVTLSVSAVPEPSTYAVIFGAGALGFAAWRRRRVA